MIKFKKSGIYINNYQWTNKKTVKKVVGELVYLRVDSFVIKTKD